VCRPADPEAKGLIDRCHDYLERSFLPGRTFTSPADFNAQLQMRPVASEQMRRSTRPAILTPEVARPVSSG
jgi:transposase